MRCALSKLGFIDWLIHKPQKFHKYTQVLD
jgi:hypothetical protein